MTTKSELVEMIALRADLSRNKAEIALEAMLESVTTSLLKGQDVVITGFGTFTTAERAARTVRNPRTGEMTEVPAARVPKFKAGAKLKDAVK